MSFAVNFISTDGFEAVELADLSTGTKVVVIPSCGAILHEMGVQHRGAYINIIDHYDNAADFEKNVTSKGFKSCKLSPFACRVKNARYRFDEKDYVIEKFLLGDNALHGLIYDAPFTVQYQYADEKSAGVALQFAYRGTDPGYPFHYDCNIIYQLKHNNTLVISTTIINQDEGLIPVQDGWHPYFNLGAPVDELLLEFQSKDQWVFDSKMIPTTERITYNQFASLKAIGDKKFDDCFTLDFTECQPLFVLRNPANRLQLEIHPDRNYPYLQIYTPDHRQSIAIENLSAPPDTFNNSAGLVILPPGGNKIFTTTYRVASLD